MGAYGNLVTKTLLCQMRAGRGSEMRVMSALFGIYYDKGRDYYEVGRRWVSVGGEIEVEECEDVDLNAAGWHSVF